MKQLFHISFDGKLEGIWQPAIPAGSDSGQKSDLTEPDVPRISCSPTIEQCFQAIYPNVSKYFEIEKYPQMDFYVYSPQLKGTERIWKPKYLTDFNLVHDAHVTEEYCILVPTFMKLVKKVRIMNTEKSSDLFYYPFDDKTKEQKYLAPKTIIIKQLEDYTVLNKTTIAKEQYKIPKILNW